MLLGISQPTFMPWIGYFGFLDKIDKIVFLDSVQFEKRSWQQRNFIKLDDQKHILTIPVKSKGKFKQKISEVEIIYDDSITVIKKKIFFAYKKSRYFDTYYEDFCKILDKKHPYLLNLNLEIIKFFLKILNIKTKFDYSSKYFLDLRKEKLIFEICKKNKCTEYLSSIGSKEYLDKHKVIPNSSIKISYFQYEDIKYTQLNKNFIPKLSILDLVFNEGGNSINIVREGLKIV